MKKIISIATFLAMAAVATLSCGSSAEQKIKFPIQFKGTFTELYEVTAFWGVQGTCIQEMAEEGTLLLEENGTATLQHPTRTLTFKHAASGECHYVYVDTPGDITTSSGTHDSKGAVNINIESARGHNRTYSGSFTKTGAQMNTLYEGEDSISGWNWRLKITGSFNSAPL